MSELEKLNQELAALLGAEPAELTSGATRALNDELVICGILGGKDVGKSTLINALAGRDVSADEQEVGEGTRRPMAYVHQDSRAAVASRLSQIEQQVPIDVTVHHADPVRNVVLVDLPDFDSQFQDHLQQVKTIAPLLDRVLWVMTPRKVGDRVWADMFRQVIKDPRNVHCVLNKIDELLSDANPFKVASDPRVGRATAFWRDQHQWMAQSLVAAGCAQEDEHRFLIAAKYVGAAEFVDRIAWMWADCDWTRYCDDRDTVGRLACLTQDEFERLRQSVLGPVSAQQVCMIKQANQRRELAEGARTLRRHYDLKRTGELLSSVCDPAYQQDLLNDAFGPDYCQTVAQSLQARLRPNAELADELLERRVEHWPLLRLVYWLFGWLPRLLGRRYAAGAAARSEVPSDPFRVTGLGLTERIDLLRSRLLADYALLFDRLGIAGEAPSTDALGVGVGAAADRLEIELESRLFDCLRAADAPPRRWKKIAVWAVLIWFPLVQPVLEGVLEMASLESTFRFVHGVYRVVLALGASRLLTGLAVVGGVYVVILTAMYANSLRDVRRLRESGDDESPVAEAIDEILLEEIVAPLTGAVQEKHQKLQALVTQLDQLAPANG